MCSANHWLPPGRLLVPKFQGENFYANKRIATGFKVLAERKGCTLPQIALAWNAAQGLLSIPGTTKPERLVENWTSREIDLDASDIAYMREIVDSIEAQGNRYNEVALIDIGN